MRKRRWDDHTLSLAVSESKSIRQVIQKVGLIPAGGNYVQIQERITVLKLDTSHFTVYTWNKGLRGRYLPLIPLKDILVRNSKFQSFKLKKRLFIENLKNHFVNYVDGMKYRKTAAFHWNLIILMVTILIIESKI